MNLKESEDGYNTRLRSGFHSEFFRGDSYETYEQYRDKNHGKSINVRNEQCSLTVCRTAVVPADKSMRVKMAAVRSVFWVLYSSLLGVRTLQLYRVGLFNPLNAELNPSAGIIRSSQYSPL